MTEFGWPVEGHLAIEDEHHRLVSPRVQKELLNSSFNMMKGNAGTGRHELDIANLLYYNIEDNNHVPKDFSERNRTEREALVKEAENWANHCGLRENVRGVGHEEGKLREAWTAFVNQAK